MECIVGAEGTGLDVAGIPTGTELPASPDNKLSDRPMDGGLQKTAGPARDYYN